MADSIFRQEVTIDVDGLVAELGSGTPPAVLDVRWKLGDAHGHDAYLAGHIPGAVFVDLETELAAPPAGARGGRHPLPAVDDLQVSARRWGIDDTSRVVVYDDWGNLAAARLWWLLRWAGVVDAVLLDGGWGGWRRGGGAVATGDQVAPQPGTVTLVEGRLPTVGIDDIDSLTGPLLDARAAERYRGDVEPVDPRAGHIPGAICAPTADNLDADGLFRPLDDLRNRFSSWGIDDSSGGDGSMPVVYCGSGINAAICGVGVLPAAVGTGPVRRGEHEQLVLHPLGDL